MVAKKGTLQAAATAETYRAASHSVAAVSCTALALAVCWKIKDKESAPGTSLSHQSLFLAAHSRPGLLVLSLLPTQCAAELSAERPWPLDKAEELESVETLAPLGCSWNGW